MTPIPTTSSAAFTTFADLLARMKGTKLETPVDAELVKFCRSEAKRCKGEKDMVSWLKFRKDLKQWCKL